jgi:hypothetical protein
MQRLINIIGIIVLAGILIKLSYVFVYLFAILDDDSLLSKITGVTFAFASVYFVIVMRQQWLKVAVVVLDVITILYYYLHQMLNINIAYASIIIAAYSGLIVYYMGKQVNGWTSTQGDGWTGTQENGWTGEQGDNGACPIAEEEEPKPKKRLSKKEKIEIIDKLQVSMF